MNERNPLTREAFNYLAKGAGLNPDDPHMDELFPYVQAALAGIERLAEIVVDDHEPASVFNPACPYLE